MVKRTTDSVGKVNKIYIYLRTYIDKKHIFKSIVTKLFICNLVAALPLLVFSLVFY